MRGKVRLRRHSLLSAYAVGLGQMVSHKRAQDALRAAAVESALANRTKSEFMANMSHELRTPLNAIIGFSGLLKEMDAQEFTLGKSRDYLDHIGNAGKHLLRIINDILTVSKIESGNFTLDIGVHPLAGLIDASVAMIYPRVTEKRQNLAVDIPLGLPAVAVDDARVKQILANLLSNASKFTPEGGKISIAVRHEDSSALICSVADTGCGMTEEELIHAQKPFAQVQSGYSRDHEGTGLGLPISKQLVLQHGGQFQITSQPNAGTTVAFTLPIAAGEAAAEPRPRTHAFRI